MDTKERILDTAERLFASEGFDGTSLRTITAEAGVNLAAVHYHFGGKEDLIRAVFVRRLGPLHQERLQRLAAVEAEAGDQPAPLEAILEAFLGPALRLSLDPAAGGATFTKLLGRIHAEPGEGFKKIYCQRFSEVVNRYAAALQRALPHLPPAELYWRMYFAQGAMAHVMCDPSKLELISGGMCEAPDCQDAEAILERLVPFLAAGLSAPVPRRKAGGDCCQGTAEPALSATGAPARRTEENRS